MRKSKLIRDICGFAGWKKDVAYAVLQAEGMLQDVYRLRYVYGF